MSFKNLFTSQDLAKLKVIRNQIEDFHNDVGIRTSCNIHPITQKKLKDVKINLEEILDALYRIHLVSVYRDDDEIPPS